MISNYNEICRDNIQRRGEEFDDIGRLISEQLYSDRSHFVYELLQNAEDALERRLKQNPNDSFPRKVQFRLFQDRLELRHFGVPFNEEDVKGISDVLKGTKKEDFSQIGKFGIGFKSVYGFTSSPEIHSGEEHFVIKRYIRPEAKAPHTSIAENETIFNFPFDHERLSAADAFDLIFKKLQGLGPRVLLFLRWIDEIEWSVELNGEKGQYLKKVEEVKNCENAHRVTVIGLGNGKDEEENWLIFERPVPVPDGRYQVRVEVGFRLETNLKNETEQIVRVKDTPLVVYFPTEKATMFGFLMQGPYRTTPSRDNITREDNWNATLARETAQLVADSIEHMRDLNLLDVSSYLALPLHVPEDSFFRDIYDSVRKALREKPLLPGHGGDFIKVEEAKLARGKELVELFSPGQLGPLFGKEKLFWLDMSITESGDMADLHTYLVGKKYKAGLDTYLVGKKGIQFWKIEPLLEELLVDADILAPKLTADFLGKQPLSWLVKFIQYAAQGSVALALKQTPFIRLVSGKQVPLPLNENELRSAWFVPKDDSGLDLKIFPLVHPELAANKDVREFLEKKGIREIDAVAIVEKSVLPKYENTNICFNESTYCVDLRRIREAYCKANDAEKTQLNTSLNKYGWLACVHASGNTPDRIVWKKPGASDLFEKTTDHEIWFDGLENVNAYFLHSSVIETLNGAITILAKTTAPLTTNLSSNECTIILSNEHSNNKRGLKGFNPAATIVGIKSALADWNQKRSKVLWKILLSAPLKIISGETQSATNRLKLDKAHKKTEYTAVGELCRKQAWLPDKSHNWRKPSELLLTDLPEGFESTSIVAKEVAEKLGIKQPEREQALERVTGGDANFKRLIEHYQSATESERERIHKVILREIPPEPAPSFKDGLKNLGRPQRGIIEHSDNERHPVSNSERYQENLNEQVGARVEEYQSTPHKIIFSPVREQPSNEEARRFLYEQYHGCCQITGTTFPKASRNTDGMAENYFEACSMLPYANADYLNDAGNMLCVSADTMAKFKYASVEFLDSLENAIETFKANGEPAESVSVKIRLAGEECSIKWSQRHFMRLVALYEKA